MSPGLGEPSPSFLLLVELTCGPCPRCTLCDADGQLEPQDQAWLSVGGGRSTQQQQQQPGWQPQSQISQQPLPRRVPL